MATVTVYREGVEAAPLARQRQQAFTAPDGVGEGLQTLGRGLNQFAQAKDAYQARVDEATANTLDADFSEAVREIERGYLNTKGMNAVDQAKAAAEAWEKTEQSFQARATNPRQQQMLAGVLSRRKARWQSQYDSHLTTQTDVWADDAEKSRISTMSVDVADLPLGSEERLEATVGLGLVLDERGRRLGWDAATRQAEGMAVFSGIHENTVGALIDSDPMAAKRYFDDHADQILPEKRNVIANRVREAELDFVSYTAVRESFVVDAPDEVEVDVAGDRQKLRIGQPVSAGIVSRFGVRKPPGGVGSSNHKGVDFRVPVNTPVEATLPGVVRVKSDPDGYGNYVVIEHGNGLETRYAHLNSVNVRDGQRVEQGDVVALSGGARGARGAGNSQGAHLHYEVRRNGQAVNPETVTGDVTVQPGGGRSSSPGRPTTEADVLDWAEAETRRRGGDWRMQRALERAGLAEVNRTRSARADAEGEAMREAEPYLPGGANAVSDVASIPSSIRNRLSPGQLRAVTNAIKAEAEGEGSVDRDLSDTTESNLRDQAAGLDGVEAQKAFLDMNLVSVRSSLSRSAYRSLENLQRQARVEAAQPTPGTTPAQALTGVADLRGVYYGAAGIKTGQTATPEDRRRRVLFDRYVDDHIIALQARQPDRPLTNEQKQGVIALAARQVEIDVDHDNNPSTDPVRERRGAFEVGRTPSYLVIPVSERAKVVRDIAAWRASRGLPAREATSAEVQQFYNGGVQEGRYALPNAPARPE